MIQILLLLLLISVSTIPALADVPTGTSDHDHRSYFQQHFDVSGYLGYQFVYGSPDPAPIESAPEVGLLVNYNIADHWTAFTQFKLETDHMEQSVAYAFMGYDNTVFDTVPINITVGKLRHGYGLYNKDRLNPRTRPGNIAPQALYWDQLRYALTSGWGVSVGSDWNNWRFRYTISKPIVVDEKEEALIWFSGARTDVEQKFGGFQLISINHVAADWRFTSSLLLQDWGYGAAGKNRIVNVGVEKRIDSVTLSLEGMVVMKHINNSYGISATAQYDANEYVTLHTNYNRYEAIFKDDAVIDRTLKHTTNSHDISVGLSLHQDDWEMRTEFHVAKGSVWVDFNEAQNPAFADWWHYGAVSVVYHF